MTTAPLLKTKLYAPRVTRGLVDRPRLSDRLDERPSVLLVSAPAGFGKSTLLAQSLLGAAPAGPAAVAWLSLDSGAATLVILEPLALAAVRTAAPDVGGSAPASWSHPEALRSPRCSQPDQRPRHVRGDVVLVLTTTTSSVRRPPRGDRLPRRPPATPVPPGHRDWMTRRCRRAAAAAASGPRYGPPTCASPRRRPRRTSTGWGSSSPPARSAPSRVEPRDGSPPSSSRPCLSEAVGLQPGSSTGSRGTSATSSTTSSRRSCTASPRRSTTPSSGHPCCPGCQDPWPTPSHDGRRQLEALDRDNLFLVPLDDQRR